MLVLSILLAFAINAWRAGAQQGRRARAQALVQTIRARLECCGS